MLTNSLSVAISPYGASMYRKMMQPYKYMRTATLGGSEASSNTFVVMVTEPFPQTHPSPNSVQSSDLPMASTNASTTTVPSTLSVQISEKLTKSNFMLWQAIRAVELEGFLTGAVQNPSHQG
jgi:hypothetical protein